MKKFLFFLFIPLIVSGFEIKDGEMEFFINRTDKINYFHFIRLNFSLDYEKVKFNFSIANTMEKFTSVSNFKVIVWKISLFYFPGYGVYAGIGDRYLNYSKFLLHLEEWEDNVFKGFFVNYTNVRYNFSFDGFIGLHAEDTNRMRFNGEYLKTDIGFINKYYVNRIKTESPSIWGCFKIFKPVNNKFLLKLIYVYENYSLERQQELFNSYFFFYNHLFELDLNTKFKNINFAFVPLFMIKQYTKYNGYGDYYGPGKHKLIVDYSHYKPIISGEVKAGFWNIEVIYRYLEKGFIPVHIDNARIKYNRGENFLDNIFTEEKGYIIKFLQPVFNNTYLGINYYSFVSTVNLKKYNEIRYIFKSKLLNLAEVLIIFYNQRGFLSDYGEIGELKGFIVKLSTEIKNKFKLDFWITENKWYIKDKDEIMINIRYRY